MGKDAFSIPSRMDVVFHIVGFVGEPKALEIEVGVTCILDVSKEGR